MSLREDATPPSSPTSQNLRNPMVTLGAVS
jgi:hypothetical protein